MMYVLAASNAPTAELLTDLLYIFGVATVVVALLHLKKLPSLLGFLITGVLVGPAGFGLIEDAAAIEIMAEVGVVLLMFTIGLEVSLADLMRMARLVIGGGVIQMGLTAVAATGVALALGMDTIPAIAVGLIVSASSTALVLRLLGDRGELGTSAGQLSLAILLFQDFAVVGLMLVFPMMAAGSMSFGGLALGLGKGVAVTAAIFLGARFLFPWLLTRVVALRSREVFLLATLATVMGTAWVADALGLSLALGAFVAGLVVSESDFSHQMFAEVLPFRDVFNGLFFVSVGLLISPDVVTSSWGLLLGMIAFVFIAKGLIVFFAAKLLGLDTAAAIVAGVALSQVGEFGLVLAQQGALLGLVTARDHSLIIATAVATMAITPLLLPWITRRVGDLKEDDDIPAIDHELSNHVIIIGYGLNGRNVARALRQLGVQYVVVEMNQATVRAESAAGVPIVYGNATRPALLHHLHVEKARALVAAVGDAAVTREIVTNARGSNPDLLIIARTRYVAEIEPLRQMGANVVVPEEFETSIELVARVMRAYGASEAAVQREKRALRGERYRALLEDAAEVETASVADLLAGLDIARIYLRDDPEIVGRTLAELDIRARTGATVLAVLREKEAYATPAASFEISGGDMLVLAGDADSIRQATTLLGKETDAAE